MEKVLPNNWVETNISSLITNDGIFIDGDWIESKDQNPDGEVRIIQLADIGVNNFRDRSDRFITKANSEKLKCTYLQKNDVLIARMPDPIGRSCVFPLDGKYVTVVDIAIVRLNKKIYNPRLFSYFTNSPSILKLSSELATGSTRQRISRKNLDTIPFPLPPLAEQERIVGKLDALFAQHEKMKQALARIPQLLKDFRHQVLTQAVTGKLTEQWRKGKELDDWKGDIIKNLADKLGSGSTPKGGSDTYLSEGIPLVRSMNVIFGGIKLDGLAFISNKQANALKNVEIHSGDILLNITGASIGRLCLADDNVIGGRVNQHVFIIRPKTKIVLSKYLEIYLRSDLIQQFIEEKKYGAGMEAISKTQIENFTIKLPSLEEQQEIVARVESLFEKAYAIETRYDLLKKKIEGLPQAILHKAFKGELVPQLPTDGDAKDLLAEILALKSETKKKK